MRKLVAALLLFSPFFVAAQTAYKVTRADGSVVFTDQEEAGAESIRLPRAQTYDAPGPAYPSSARGDQRDGVVEGYERLIITAPQSEAVIQRHNGPHIAAVELKPPLAVKQGHAFVFTLDGEVIGTSTEPRFPLGDLYRGAHTVSVAVVNGDGRVLIQSEPVTFYIRQHSRLFNN